MQINLVVIVLTVFCIINGGCGPVPIPIDIDNMAKKKSQSIIIGNTTSEEMIHLYGNPVIKNEHFEYGVYSGKCYSRGVFLPLFLPLKFEETCYVLVKYDGNIVKAIDVGAPHSFELSVNDIIFRDNDLTVIIPWKSKTQYEHKKENDKDIINKCQTFVSVRGNIGSIFIDGKYVGHGWLWNGKYFHYLVQDEGTHRLSACYYMGSTEEDLENCETIEYSCNKFDKTLIFTDMDRQMFSKNRIIIEFNRSFNVDKYIDDGYLIIDQLNFKSYYLFKH